MAILITNHTVYDGDRGMVVVGGSIDLGDLLAAEDPLTQVVIMHKTMGRSGTGNAQVVDGLTNIEHETKKSKSNTKPCHIMVRSMS